MKDEPEEQTNPYHHPTTPEQANYYEYLRHAHCHRCPDQEDCDVEDFLNCEVPIDLAVSWDNNAERKFRKCNCLQCIDDKTLQQLLQSYYRRVKKLYKIEEPKKKKAEIKKKGPTKVPFKKKLGKAPLKKPVQQKLFGAKKIKAS